MKSASVMSKNAQWLQFKIAATILKNFCRLCDIWIFLTKFNGNVENSIDNAYVMSIKIEPEPQSKMAASATLDFDKLLPFAHFLTNSHQNRNQK